MPNKGTYKGASAGTVRAIVTDMSEEEKQQKQTFVSRCLQGVSSCLLGLVSCVTEHHTGDYIKHKESVEEVLLGLVIATLTVGDDDGAFKKVADNGANMVKGMKPCLPSLARHSGPCWYNSWVSMW